MEVMFDTATVLILVALVYCDARLYKSIELRNGFIDLYGLTQDGAVTDSKETTWN